MQLRLCETPVHLTDVLSKVLLSLKIEGMPSVYSEGRALLKACSGKLIMVPYLLHCMSTGVLITCIPVFLPGIIPMNSFCNLCIAWTFT